MKELAPVISKPLASIFNKSLNTYILPNAWKQPNITAIFKKGNRKSPENYRPISLTSISCKLMESIMRDIIMKYLHSNNLICNNQFGLIKGRSTNLQLLNVLDNWTISLDNKTPIDVILMDFKKAFDSVPHLRLITKLKAYGFENPLLGWINNFITGRTQRVSINGSFSNWHRVRSGIPQGSVLGPLLFVLYINDLPLDINSSIYMFADDTKISRPISTINDCMLLQDDINTLQSWSDKWLLTFHPDKCHVLSLGKNTIPYNYTLPNNNNNTTTILGHVDEARDLGVIVDKDLSFDSHINNKVNKANNTLGLLRRAYIHLDINSLAILYKALVRPHLEFANVIWHPYKKKHIHAIEAVQRRATKLLSILKNLTYKERLIKLNIPTLVFRRLRGDMIETFKITSEIYDPNVTSFINTHANSRTRGNQHKL